MLLEWSYVNMSPASLAIAVLLATPLSLSLIFVLDSNALFITSAIRRFADALSSAADAIFCSLFAGCRAAPSSNNAVLRCPGATMVSSEQTQRRNLRTMHIPVLLRRWTSKMTSFRSTSSPRSGGVTSPKSPGGFWPEYKKIADELTGLFGPLHSYEFPEECKILQPFVTLADEAPYLYNQGCADKFRAWLAYHLAEIDAGDGGFELTKAVESLDISSARACLGASVYLRHAWHQGSPTDPVLGLKTPKDSYGEEVFEPMQLKLVNELLAERLEVAPFLNCYTWLFCNWTWEPKASSAAQLIRDAASSLLLLRHRKGEGPSSDLFTPAKPLPLRQSDLLDASVGQLSPRFFWLTGSGRESEANFWRSFAYSEMVAVPLYGLAGRLLEQVENQASSGGPPSDEAAAIVLDCLKQIKDITHNITAQLVLRVTMDQIEVEPFLQMQNTAHFAGESAGASGFQAPCIVLLDVLMGVDHTRESEKLQEARAKNLEEMHPKVLKLIYEIVGPSAPLLRDFILALEGTSKGEELSGAFRGVLDELVMWRSSHRARAVQWLASSTVTTGRTAEDVSSQVAATFRAEMDEIIQSTKAASDISGRASHSPPSGVSSVRALVKSLSNRAVRLMRQISASAAREGPDAGAGDDEEVYDSGGSDRSRGEQHNVHFSSSTSRGAEEKAAAMDGDVHLSTEKTESSSTGSGWPVFGFRCPARRSRHGK